MANHSAQSAYKETIRTTTDSRQIESRLLIRNALQIEAAEKRKKEEFGLFAEALHENLKLWLVIAAEVAGEGNLLSQDLRAGLLYLVDFTRLQTARVLQGEANADILVEINRSVAAGLKGDPGKGVASLLAMSDPVQQPREGDAAWPV